MPYPVIPTDDRSARYVPAWRSGACAWVGAARPAVRFTPIELLVVVTIIAYTRIDEMGWDGTWFYFDKTQPQ